MERWGSDGRSLCVRGCCSFSGFSFWGDGTYGGEARVLLGGGGDGSSGFGGFVLLKPVHNFAFFLGYLDPSCFAPALEFGKITAEQDP